jgi:hypothetical protein
MGQYACTCRVGFVAGVGQGLDEVMPIRVVQENPLAPVSSAHYV